MRVTVDRTKCTALGNCEAIAPAYFEVNDEGEMQILRDTVGDDDLRDVRRAVSGCPNAALSLIDDGPDDAESSTRETPGEHQN
ncbi:MULTISPECIES: ferredoxin [Gordonia]|uniref:ferredoxin n=1 Tax=Gordonia TaxID=2053 RepID=UPI0032649A40